MGLLDDAIKEHLELKRKRGADPAEVAQQEREALGPVRGAADTATVDAPAPAPVVDDPEPAEPEFHGAVRAPDPEPELEPDPAPDAALPPEPPEPVSQPTRQFSADEVRGAVAEPSVEDAVPADEEPGEDVLDETPDFLQEAPEHDRLWFEQRPPRDFDF
jgi:hypothetical protein